MKKLFFILALTFFILFMINIVWIVINLYNWAKDGIESIVQGQNLLENIYLSKYIKWILWCDGLWIIFALIFMLRRKHYKTNALLHYLQYSKISNPSICIVIPTYNEELSIEKVIKDFQKQKSVKSIIVIDNNSNDQTPNIAEKCGVKVIRKNINKGYAHSFVLGLKESLKTEANIIATTEGDYTFNAYDLEKMIPYLDNCDIVIGTRQNQVLTEKGNQNSLLRVWGNFLLAKLIQMKYFSLLHMGIVNLTDVGCVYMVMKRQALEKIVDHLTYPNTDEAIGGIGVGLHLTMLGIENDLRIIEVPVTFNKRIGMSKLEPKKIYEIKVGLKFIWVILTK